MAGDVSTAVGWAYEYFCRELLMDAMSDDLRDVPQFMKTIEVVSSCVVF
jgi:hypothetical protein